jgi:spore maturation protein A
MLNWIWAVLIVSSFLFALGNDVSDINSDKYRNDQPLPVQLSFPEGYDPAARSVPVRIRLDSAQYAQFYGSDAKPDTAYTGYLRLTQRGTQLRFDAETALPEPLATIATVSKSRDDELQGRLQGFTRVEPAQGALPPTATAGVVFEPVRFVKMNAIAAAAIEFAETAAELALGLIGVLALFLGMLKIAEHAGVIYGLVKITRPILRPLFPEIPPDHPALGMIALNLTANVFGLGNAATPFGIKAMEEMQKLNSTKDTATNSMVMLLAMNTASVQLMPPVLLIAILGLQVNELILPIWIVTVISLIIGIIAAKLYAKLPSMRRSDPANVPVASTRTDTIEEV